MRTARRPWLLIVLFLSPAVVLFTFFLAVPIVNSIRLSFFSGSFIGETTYVGLQNYVTLFTKKPHSIRFPNATLNCVRVFLYATVIQNLPAFIIAYMLTRKVKGANAFRSVYFIPSILPVVAVGFLFLQILNPVWGVFNRILKFAGLGALIVPWMGNPKTALPAIAFVSSWQYMGVPLVLFTAAIQGIDEELIDACRIDGASQPKALLHIVTPLVMPIIGINFVLTYIGCFLSFDVFYAMTGTWGNPNYSTDVLATYFYRMAFGDPYSGQAADLGLGAAIATMTFLFVLVGVALWLRVFRRRY